MTTIFGLELSYQIGWLLIAIIFGIIELGTLGLTTIWFALGAIVTMFFAMIGIGIVWQILIFLIVSGILLYFTRPIADKYLKIGKVRTNVDSVIGTIGLVTKQIEEFNTGQVKVQGQIWTAKSYDGSVIEEGTEIKVIKVEGVKLLVMPKEFTKGE